MAAEVDLDFQREKIELEQNIFELQAQLESTRAKLGDSTRCCEELRLRAENVEASRNEKIKWAHELENINAELESRKAELQRQNIALSQDKELLLKLFDDKKEEITRLQNDKRGLRVELNGLYTEKCVQQAKLDDVSCREASLEHKEKRWVQEKTLILEEKNFAYTQMIEKERMVQQLRREMSTKLMDRQAQLEVSENENSRLKCSLNSLTDEKENLTKQCEELSLKLKQASELNANSMANHEREILCQSKLISVYKESSEEAEKKIEELTRALEDTQNLFIEAKDSHINMQEMVKSMEVEQAQFVDGKDVEIKELKDELEKANELLRSKHRVMLSDEEIAALSPGAAAAGRLIRSGHTLTQIYRENLKIVEELDNQKMENRRLEQYFRELVQDIEQKAPILKRQQEEYFRVVEIVAQMKLQLAGAEQEKSRLTAEKDGCLRQLTYTKAELERRHGENSDLTSQNRELLLCIEKVRRGDYDYIAANSFDRTLDAEDLLLYRNIDELQCQNQRLSSALKEAEAKREEMIKAAQDAEMTRIKNALLSALRELDDLKDSSRKQEKLIEAIADQRDTYQRLLMEKTALIAKGHAADFSALSSSERSENQVADELKLAIEKLNVEFEVYREQKCAVEKILNEKIDKLQAELTGSRASNAKLNAEVEYQQERFKILQNNTDTYKNEIKSLRERNEKFSATIGRQEEGLSALSQELLRSSEEVGKLKVLSSHLQEKFEQTNSNAIRLDQEVQMLRNNSYNQQMLTSTLDSLQTRLERTEAEQTLRLKSDLELMTRERNNLQESLAKSNQNHDLFVKNNLNKLAELDGQLEDKKRAVERLNCQLASTVQQLADAESRCKSYKDDLNSIRTSGEDGSNETHKKNAQVLQSRLLYMEERSAEANKKIAELIEKLELSKTESDQLQKLSNSLESGLDEQKKAVELDKSVALKQIADMQTELAALRSENLALAEDSHNLNEKLVRIIEESAEKLQAVEKEAKKLNEDLSSAQEKVDSSARREAQLKSDLSQYIHHTNEHKKNLDLSNAKICQLEAEFQSCRLKLEEASLKLVQSTEKSAHLQNLVDNHEQIVSDIKNKFESEMVAFSDRSCELEKVNKTLAEEASKLATSLASLERLQASSNFPGGLDETAASFLSLQDIQEQSCGSLSEIIKSLTEERAQKVARLQEADSEVMKLKKRENLLQNEIDGLNDKLSSAQLFIDSAHQVALEKTELLTKLGQLSSVQETNVLLLKDKQELENFIDSLKNTIFESNEKIAKLVAVQNSVKASLDEQNKNFEAAKKANEQLELKHFELIEARGKFESDELNKLRSELHVATQKCSKVELEMSTLMNENDTLKKNFGILMVEKEKLTSFLNEEHKNLIKLQKIALKYKKENLATRTELEDVTKQNEELKQKLQVFTAMGAESATSQKPEEIMSMLGQKVMDCQSQLEDLELKHKELIEKNKASESLLEEKAHRVTLLEDLLEKSKAGGEKSQEQQQKPVVDGHSFEVKAISKTTPVQPVQAIINERPQNMSGIGRPQQRPALNVTPISRGRTTVAVTPTTVSLGLSAPDQSFSAPQAQIHQQQTSAVSTSSSGTVPLQHSLPIPILPHAIVRPSTEFSLSDDPPEFTETRNNEASSAISSSSATFGLVTSQDLQGFLAGGLGLHSSDAPSTSSKRRMSSSDTTELMAGTPKRRALSPVQVSTSSQPDPNDVMERSVPDDLDEVTAFEEEQDIVQEARQIVGSSDNNNNDNEVLILDDEGNYSEIKELPVQQLDDDMDEMVEEVQETVGYQQEEEDPLGRGGTPTFGAYELTESTDSDMQPGMHIVFSANQDEFAADFYPNQQSIDNEAATSSIENLLPMTIPDFQCFSHFDVQQPQSSGQADVIIDSCAGDVTEEATSEAIAAEQEEFSTTEGQMEAASKTSKSAVSKMPVKLKRPPVGSKEPVSGEPIEAPSVQAVCTSGGGDPSVSAPATSSSAPTTDATPGFVGQPISTQVSSALRGQRVTRKTFNLPQRGPI